MLRKLQRLGGGPLAVGAITWRASSPGSSCKRSVSSSRWSKTPPTGPTRGMSQQSTSSLLFGGVEPLVKGIRVTRFQETLLRDAMRRLALGNFQEGGTAFPHEGVRVMIAVGQQILVFLLGQFKGPLLGHGLLHSGKVLMPLISYYRF